MSRQPLIGELYRQYQVDQDAEAFAGHIKERYTLGTLERLVAHEQALVRRAAAFAVGLIGDYRSNAVLGKALHDDDQGVRVLAESGIRVLWCRSGNAHQRHELGQIIRLNSAHRYEDAIRRATRLLGDSPWIAEVWNQRAIAQFCRGHYEESIRDCAQALEVNPYHFGAASGMGQCYFRQGDRSAALESFRRALELNPNLDSVRAQIDFLERTPQE